MNNFSTNSTDPRRAVYVFCDLSNIYFTLQNHYPHEREALRLNFRNFNQMLIGPSRYAAQPPLWVTSDKQAGRASTIGNHLTFLGVDLVIRPRVDGRETDVDAHLVDAINRMLDTQPPAVLVIATGDGAGFYRNTGFLTACHRAQALGWAVEVLAWSRSCHRALRAFAETAHGFTDLDHHYRSITHVDGARSAQPISWKRRAIATFPQHRNAA